MHTVGIDVGSTNVKVVLVGHRDEGLASASRPLQTVRQDRRAELDAAELWRTVVAALGDLAAAAVDVGVDGLGEVGAVGVCGQYSSIVAVDEELEPVAPLRLYLDTRGTPHARAVLANVPGAPRHLDRAPPDPAGRRRAVARAPAGVPARRARRPPSDARLPRAGRLRDRPAHRRGLSHPGVDVRLPAGRQPAARPDRATTRTCCASPASIPTRLPPLVAPGAAVGTVRADVAAATASRAEAVVVAGITDSHAFALATGAAVPGRIGVAIGTTPCCWPPPTASGRPDSDVLAMPGVEPGEYLVWAENGLAGRVVEQILTAFVHGSDALGDHAVDDVFQGFDAALLASPGRVRPGCGSCPWFGGVDGAGGRSRPCGAAFLGVSLDTRRVDLVRARGRGGGPQPPVAGGSGGGPGRRAGGRRGGRAHRWRAARRPGRRSWPTWSGRCPYRAGAGRPRPRAGPRAVAAWAARRVDRSTGSVRRGPPDPGPDRAATGPGSRWGGATSPTPGSIARCTTSAHQQFTAAFDALRPLRLGPPPSAPELGEGRRPGRRPSLRLRLGGGPRGGGRRRERRRSPGRAPRTAEEPSAAGHRWDPVSSSMARPVGSISLPASGARRSTKRRIRRWRTSSSRIEADHGGQAWPAGAGPGRRRRPPPRPGRWWRRWSRPSRRRSSRWPASVPGARCSRG